MKKGKFKRGTHSKTGEWGLMIKYVIPRWSRQPTDESLIYFYSEIRTIVETPGFRLILVRLEQPFPEDKPEGPEGPSTPPSQPETPSESLQTLIEELKKKWGAR